MTATEAADLAAAFKALADPVRLRIASIVACCPAGEVCMGEIASEFSVSPSTISHHLKKLREAGVLASERRATEVYYQVRSDRLDALIGQLTAMRSLAGQDSRPIPV
ncbi:metalloregulator ArsR/SmtB family transcription factor [Streptomyces sp. G1]|uniref:ArsR/SmtB family transcription factor n=1 Tax=Streptomyces sp. G1 TaxID=361572 RepID=UPI00202F55C8|nr:metalloregulator ArsR/SmtB family transcription factor [Streptomyces sp. G1]MCM1971341.1 metalloregulator ArsR/SmtB family transcription factor [Streptomyces sp. G1]